MRFGGIFFAAVLLVGACSGDPEPKEPDPTLTPSSTATLPAMPAQAKENTPEGAAAFVDHWVDVFNYASQTGDVDELTRLSSPECEGCQSYINLYRDTYTNGGYYSGGEWAIGDFTTRSEGSTSFLTVEVVAPASKFRESSTDPEMTEAAYKSTVTFIAEFSSAWRVAQVGTGTP